MFTLFTDELAKKYTHTLVTCPYFIDYAEAVIIDERILLKNQVIYDFLVQFFPKTSSSVLTEQMFQIMECLMSTLNDIDSQQQDTVASCAKLNAELRALSIVYCMQPPLLPLGQFRPLLRKFLTKVKSKQVLIGESSRKKTSKCKEAHAQDSIEVADSSVSSADAKPAPDTTHAATDDKTSEPTSAKVEANAEPVASTSREDDVATSEAATKAQASSGSDDAPTAKAVYSTTRDKDTTDAAVDSTSSEGTAKAVASRNSESADKAVASSSSEEASNKKAEYAVVSQEATAAEQEGSDMAEACPNDSSLQWPSILEKTILDLINVLNTKAARHEIHVQFMPDVATRTVEILKSMLTQKQLMVAIR